MPLPNFLWCAFFRALLDTRFIAIDANYGCTDTIELHLESNSLSRPNTDILYNRSYMLAVQNLDRILSQESQRGKQARQVASHIAVGRGGGGGGNRGR